jgi:hypothetical protein
MGYAHVNGYRASIPPYNIESINGRSIKTTLDGLGRPIRMEDALLYLLCLLALIGDVGRAVHWWLPDRYNRLAA